MHSAQCNNLFFKFCSELILKLLKHYHLEVQANPPKKWHKKPMLFLASMGETGISHYIFFNSHLGLLRLLRLKEAA